MPKGDCFTVAWQLAMEDEDGDLVICHGLPVGRGPENDGQRFWHAWCEREVAPGDWQVIDYSNDLEIETIRELYYAIGRLEPDRVWRYTVEEAAEVSLSEETYGPWVEGWQEMGL